MLFSRRDILKLAGLSVPYMAGVPAPKVVLAADSTTLLIIGDVLSLFLRMLPEGEAILRKLSPEDFAHDPAGALHRAAEQLSSQTLKQHPVLAPEDFDTRIDSAIAAKDFTPRIAGELAEILRKKMIETGFRSIPSVMELKDHLGIEFDMLNEIRFPVDFTAEFAEREEKLKANSDFRKGEYQALNRIFKELKSKVRVACDNVSKTSTTERFKITVPKTGISHSDRQFALREFAEEFHCHFPDADIDFNGYDRIIIRNPNSLAKVILMNLAEVEHSVAR